jgi:hypothetical protein
MTTAPARPLVHAYLGDGDPMEIVDSPFGKMEREKAKAMATGEFSGLVELSKQIRNDAATIAARHEAREAALNARDDAISAREREHAVGVARFTDFVGKAALLFDRLEKARADQDREPIALPPDNQHKLPEPKLEVEGDAIPGKASGDDRAGDGLRLRMPVAMDQAEFPTGEELPAPPEIKAPIAAGLDHED